MRRSERFTAPTLDAAAEAARRIQAAYHVGDEPPAELKLVKEIINE